MQRECSDMPVCNAVHGNHNTMTYVSMEHRNGNHIASIFILYIHSESINTNTHSHIIHLAKRLCLPRYGDTNMIIRNLVIVNFDYCHTILYCMMLHAAIYIECGRKPHSKLLWKPKTTPIAHAHTQWILAECITFFSSAYTCCCFISWQLQWFENGKTHYISLLIYRI